MPPSVTAPLNFTQYFADTLGFEIRNIAEGGGVQFIVIDTFVNAPVFLGSASGSEAEKRRAVIAFMQKIGVPKTPPPR